MNKNKLSQIKSRKIYLVLESMRKTLCIVANTLYLVMFAVLVARTFLSTTEFAIPWKLLAQSENVGCQTAYMLLFSPQVLLAVIVIFQYLFSADYNWKEYVLALVLGVWMFHITDANGGTNLLVYVLLALGARNFRFRTLMWVYFPIALLISAATVAGSQLGWVENLIYTAREGRMSFGFIYPTDCAAHFLFLGLGYWYMRGKKLHYPEILVFFALGLAAWYGCKGRFSTVLLMLVTASALAYLFLSKRVKDPQRWDQICQGIPSKILVLVPLLCNLGVHIISICYSDANEFLVWFNRILSNRLLLVKKGIDIYGFRLWGSNIPMVGSGGDVNLPSKYYYIDSSFMQVSLLYGLAALAVVLILFTMACLYARREKDWILLLVLVFVALHGLFEHHAFQLAYSPFLLAAFCRSEEHTKIQTE